MEVVAGHNSLEEVALWHAYIIKPRRVHANAPSWAATGFCSLNPSVLVLFKGGWSISPLFYHVVFQPEITFLLPAPLHWRLSPLPAVCYWVLCTTGSEVWRWHSVCFIHSLFKTQILSICCHKTHTCTSLSLCKTLTMRFVNRVRRGSYFGHSEIVQSNAIQDTICEARGNIFLNP